MDYELIRETLNAHGITKEYTDAQLDIFIMEAKLLVDEPFMNNSQEEEYTIDWQGDTYYTKNYPIITSSVELRINNKKITPKHITSDGLIYLPHEYEGTVECNYITGLQEEDINNYLVPIIVCLIEEKEGMNIASINEGDISISYNNSAGYSSNTLDSLVNSLKERYSARVRLI